MDTNRNHVICWDWYDGNEMRISNRLTVIKEERQSKAKSVNKKHEKTIVCQYGVRYKHINIKPVHDL